ncbi:hypothetical protein PRK78_002364 [Emydomyces testavorans]|uniref:Uncharacterized protein n=1 Tax=Emydomyces testavorans TaxID=2070801 RepID=A0AAF0IHI6_9EURO|nr:hypothetical protein PRK78_002364 [Emydomyces testavorans]
MASDFPGYLIARAFQGLGVSPPLTVGMGTEGPKARTLDDGGQYWISTGTTLYAGGGILVDVVGANWDNWLSAILLGLLLLLQLFLMPETLYPRTLMLSKMPKAHGVARPADQEKALEYTTCVQEFKLKRTKELSFFNLSPVPGLKHPKVWDTAIRFLHTFRLYVLYGSFLLCVLLGSGRHHQLATRVRWQVSSDSRPGVCWLARGNRDNRTPLVGAIKRSGSAAIGKEEQ